jgi:hypothetical protein
VSVFDLRTIGVHSEESDRTQIDHRPHTDLFSTNMYLQPVLRGT